MDDRNNEHYHDPTATEAVRKASERDAEINFLIKALKFHIKKANCKLLERIKIEDNTNGRRYF